MSLKEIRICDGCGRELEKTSDIFNLVLKTHKFLNVMEMDWLEVNLDFCLTCAKKIMVTLKTIANYKEASCQQKKD